MNLDCRITLSLQPSPDPTKGIIKVVHYAFLQRNNSVIGNLNAFRANLCAAFGDVAIADPLFVSQLLGTIRRIERMHLQRSDMDQKPRPNESLVHLVIAQHVADILAKKAFDAFAEFLYTIDVLLLHSPCPVGRIRRPRLKWLDCFLHAIVPGDVRDQVFQNWKSFHRLDCHRFLQWKLAESRHTHQFGHSVDFRRAGAALAGLTIPAARQVRRLRTLNIMNRVEHDHALGNFGGVITKFAAFGVTPPDFENGFHDLTTDNADYTDTKTIRSIRAIRGHFISSMICFK